MLVELNEKITLAAVRLDQRVAGCSLLSIPEGKWRTFTRLVYVHFGVATLLFMFGIICFCVGMQYSGMYNEVNCADGTNIWIPLLNLVVSFSGLFALRTLHLHWPAFIHCVGLWLMLLMMLVPIVDSAFASSRWFDRAKRPLDSWATNFSWIDLTLSLIACINEVVCSLLIVILVKYWYRRESSRQNETHSSVTS